MDRCILSPSILAADFSHLGSDVQKAEKAGCQWLHLDVMDGRFVPSLSFGFPIIESLRPVSGLVFDVHLMIEEPERYLERFAKSGADRITIHAEATSHIREAIGQIHALGLKAGLAINPETPVDALYDHLDEADMFLLMTVHPGFGGQKYIDDVTPKIRALRTLLRETGRQTDIQVDGGIGPANVRMVKEAGANVFVAGSSVFHGDIAGNTKKFLTLLDEE